MLTGLELEAVTVQAQDEAASAQMPDMMDAMGGLFTIRHLARRDYPRARPE